MNTDFIMEVIGFFFSLLSCILITVSISIDIIAIYFFRKQTAKVIDYLIYPLVNNGFFDSKHQYYSIHITYEYIFDDIQYQSNRLNGSTGMMKPELVVSEKYILEDMIDKQEDGHYIQVYICPFYPQYAVVFPLKLNYPLYIFGSIGAFF